jgi:hypothetical protein
VDGRPAIHIGSLEGALNLAVIKPLTKGMKKDKETMMEVIKEATSDLIRDKSASQRLVRHAPVAADIEDTAIADPFLDTWTPPLALTSINWGSNSDIWNELSNSSFSMEVSFPSSPAEAASLEALDSLPRTSLLRTCTASEYDLQSQGLPQELTMFSLAVLLFRQNIPDLNMMQVLHKVQLKFTKRENVFDTCDWTHVKACKRSIQNKQTRLILHKFGGSVTERSLKTVTNMVTTVSLSLAFLVKWTPPRPGQSKLFSPFSRWARTGSFQVHFMENPTS